ncbi:MAG: hypothetical protein R3C49_27490, partial [Planctomycetaceae bacterium]
DSVEDSMKPTRAIVFQKDAGQITGGGVFTIGCASNADVASSDFFVDHNLDMTFELIAPDVSPGSLPTATSAAADPEFDPRCDLDLIHVDHETDRYVVLDDSQSPSSTKGFFLDSLVSYAGNQAFIDARANHSQIGGDFGNQAASGFELVLQRRLNPHLPSVENTTGQPNAVDVNPWIDVDRIRVVFRDFNLASGDTAPQIERPSGHLNNIRSTERPEPLDDNNRQLFPDPTVVSDHRLNSIGNGFNVTTLQNPAEPQDPTTNPVQLRRLWQPHFDRDFVSAGELLNIPVYGPGMLTQKLKQSRLAPEQQLNGSSLMLKNASGSAALFLRPDFDSTSITNTENDNRWYRLFQFAEVPSRVHRMLGNYLNQTRLPGKININMLRHMEVFAGLIDEPMFADLDNSPDNSPFLRDTTTGAFRDRWMELMVERDGDPVSGYFVYDPTPAFPASGDEIQMTSARVPGTPNARPFRGTGTEEFDSDGSGTLDPPEDTNRNGILDPGEDLNSNGILDAEDRNGNGIMDSGADGSVFRTLASDITDGDAATNRHWLEVGDTGSHTGPNLSTTTVERHQVLSKIMNNVTNTSNTFVVFATAAYFEAWEEPTTGFVRVGGRVNIQDNGTTNPGWQQRSVFVIDRTEAYKAFDGGTGDFDWQRLIKYEAAIE